METVYLVLAHGGTIEVQYEPDDWDAIDADMTSAWQRQGLWNPSTEGAEAWLNGQPLSVINMAHVIATGEV